MKKNLRNILALSLGLMTTVAFAQDWGVDSRTRIDAGGDNDKMTTDQRVTLGATWGGSDWGIHVSSDVNYTLGADNAGSMSIYEAYASTDLMGYASLTAGRMAINNGSGALMSSNDWNANRNTWEGMKFGLNLDMADITIGYHRENSGLAGEENAGNMWVNAGGEFSGWNVNVLYMTEEGSDNAATGIDISGELAGASVHGSMNKDANEGEMNMLGISYAVNDDMTVTGGYTAYGDVAFSSATGNMGANGTDSWTSHGNMGYLGANDENMSLGLTYSMGSINLGATMHQISNSEDEGYERDVMEISLGYSLNSNSGLSVKYATDAANGGDDVKYTWVTLNVGL
jgi:hypothetical protein